MHTSQDDVRAIRLHPATIRRPSPAPVPNDTYTEPTPPSTPLTYRSDDEPYSLPASDSRLAYVILGSGTRDAMLVALLEALRDRILPWTPGDVLFFHTGERARTSLRTHLFASAHTAHCSMLQGAPGAHTVFQDRTALKKQLCSAHECIKCSFHAVSVQRSRDAAYLAALAFIWLCIRQA